jgi:RNA polymerase sigma-70 factor, ECF subfamily
LEAEKLVDAATVNLIRRCKKNEGDAYNQLLRQYEAYLYRICYNYTRNKEEALDMMQEVYIKIFRGLRTFDESRPLLPWLKRITINTLINHSNKNRLAETSLDGNWSSEDVNNQNTNPQSYLAAATNIEEQVIESYTRNIIDKLIVELPKTYRIALALRYNEDMSYDEIASVLDLPLGTVKNNIYRARKILRQRMQACELLEV